MPLCWPGSVCVYSMCNGVGGEIEEPFVQRAMPVSMWSCTIYSAGLICYLNTGMH